MADYRYAFTGSMENAARAVARNAPISYKTATEVCRFVRGKLVTRALRELDEVKNEKLAVPYKRYLWNVGHRGKGSPGRYPYTCAVELIRLLNAATAHAQSKGLSTPKLRIVHICVQQAPHQLRGGRFRGRLIKRAHVEVVVAESTGTEKKKRVAHKAKTVAVPQINKTIKQYNNTTIKQ